MSLQKRIGKLEHRLHADRYGVVLADGRTVPVERRALLECCLSAMEGKAHPLMATIRQTDSGNGSNIVSLIQSFDHDGHQRMMAGMRRAPADQPGVTHIN